MRLILSALLVLFYSNTWGQDTLTVDMLVPDKAIKVSPLHLINFYPSVQVAYEQKISRRTTLQLDMGYVFDYDGDNDPDFQNKRGVKGKLEGRYYFWGRTDRKKMYYGSAEGYANVINFDRHDFRQECFDLECNDVFMREYNYTMKYREQGVSLKAGMIRYMGDRFIFDLNSGFTLRHVEYREPPNLPPSWMDFMFFPDIPNERDRVTISPNLGIRFGYRLK